MQNRYRSRLENGFSEHYNPHLLPDMQYGKKKLLNTSLRFAENTRLLTKKAWDSDFRLQVFRSSKPLGAVLRVGVTAEKLWIDSDIMDKIVAHRYDIIRCALVTTGVSVLLEPNSLFRSDGKKPDRYIIVASANR